MSPLPFFIVLKFMYRKGLNNSLNPEHLFDTIDYKIKFNKEHPYFFNPFGTCIFCGAQGYGKTLSAVQYICHIMKRFPRAILVSNVAIKSYPFNAYLDGETVRRLDDDSIVTTESILFESENHPDYTPYCLEYTGLDMLKFVSNGEYGVVFLIDEIHLELNSLESKNIDIEVMVEISQQRKQRKHIVGTSQIYMRMAKPLREQIHDIIICRCFFNVIQYNKWIAGDTAVEKNGKVEADVKGRYLWWHAPEYYAEYDTFVKMKRYNQEWQGRKRIDNLYSERGDYNER